MDDFSSGTEASAEESKGGRRFAYGLGKRLLLGLGAAAAVWVVIMMALSIISMEGGVDQKLAEQMGMGGGSQLDEDDVCASNVTFLANYRPIAFYVQGDAQKSVECGFSAGSGIMHLGIVVLALIFVFFAFMNLIRIKHPKMQLFLSGGAALLALIIFVMFALDANSIRVAATHPACNGLSVVVNSAQRQTQTLTFACTKGKYVVVVLFELLAVLVCGVYAFISFKYVRTGSFAAELNSTGYVNYFAEAERYFPDQPSDAEQPK